MPPKRELFAVVISFESALLIVHGFAIMVLARRRKKIHYKEAKREANNALTGDERNILLQNNKNILWEIKKHLKRKNHERKKEKCIKIEKKNHGEANSKKVEAKLMFSCFVEN